MSDARANRWRGAASALLRSYVADLRRWAAELASGYALAAALLVGSVLALFAAVAVGITALFHLVERHYGTDAAYGGIGGSLLVLAIVLFVSAWVLLRRQMPPLPRPHRQVQAARKILTGPAARRALGGLTAEAVKTDPVAGLLMGAAATMLVGWFVASRLQSPARVPRVRR
jgi:hypothetical protein